MTFKKYLESDGKSKATIEHYNYYLLDYLAWLDKDKIEAEIATSKDIMAYLGHLKTKGQANKTRNYRLRAIKHFYDWKIILRQLEYNPARQIKLRGTKTKTLYPILSRQELELLHTEYQIPEPNAGNSNRNWFVKSRLSKQRNKVLIGLMVNQGITTAEAGKIEVNDLNLRAGTLHIKGSRKSNARDLELKPHQIMDLMEYQLKIRTELLELQNNPDTQYLFLAVPAAGKRSTASNGQLQVWKGLRNELRKLQPKLINFKQIRASVIVLWLKQYNLREVQYRAGHRYVSSTEAYLSGQIDDLQADIDRFHPI